MKTRRYGTFKVDARFFHELGESLVNGQLEGANLFAGMIVLDTTVDWASDARLYRAVHPQFREIRPGELSPEYRAVFHPGRTEPEWQEIKKVDETYDDMLARLRKDKTPEQAKPASLDRRSKTHAYATFDEMLDAVGAMGTAGVWCVPYDAMLEKQSPLDRFVRRMKIYGRAVASWWSVGS